MEKALLYSLVLYYCIVLYFVLCCNHGDNNSQSIIGGGTWYVFIVASALFFNFNCCDYSPRCRISQRTRTWYGIITVPNSKTKQSKPTKNDHKKVIQNTKTTTDHLLRVPITNRNTLNMDRSGYWYVPGYLAPTFSLKRVRRVPRASRQSEIPPRSSKPQISSTVQVDETAFFVLCLHGTIHILHMYVYLLQLACTRIQYPLNGPKIKNGKWKKTRFTNFKMDIYSQCTRTTFSTCIMDHGDRRSSIDTNILLSSLF